MALSGNVHRLISDIHLEYRSSIEEVTSKLKLDQNTILLLAGDIGKPATQIYQDFIKYVAIKCKYVLITAGNHEYWSSKRTHDKIDTLITEITNKYTNVYYLHSKSVVLDGIKYIGATLWSDTSKNEVLISELMNDYQHIKIKEIRENLK